MVDGNVLTNIYTDGKVSPFTSFSCDWLDWVVFGDQNEGGNCVGANIELLEVLSVNTFFDF